MGLFSSLAEGVSTAKNLLNSQDVMAALNAIKRLGIQYKFKKVFVKFMEKESMVIIIKKI